MSRRNFFLCNTLTFLLLCCLKIPKATGQDPPDNAILKSVQEIAKIGDEATGRHVDLTAVLTFVDVHFQDYIIQQGNHAIQIGRLGLPNLTAGEIVRVSGTVRHGVFGNYIEMENSERMGTSALPDRVSVDLSWRSFDEADDRYSIVQGEVIQAICSDNHTTLACRVDDKIFHVSQPTVCAVDEMNRLLYREFEFTGCLGLQIDILMAPKPIAFRIN